MAIHACQSKIILHLTFLRDDFFKYRYSVTQKGHRVLLLVYLFNNLMNVHRALLNNGMKFVFSVKEIKSCIGLVSSGIHNGTNKLFMSPQIPSQSIHRRHRNQRLFKCQSKSLCGSGTDAKSCKRARPRSHSDGIDTIHIHLQHSPKFIQHRKKSL